MALIKRSYLKLCIIACIVFSGKMSYAQDSLKVAQDSVQTISVQTKKDSLRHSVYLNAFAALPKDDFQSTDNLNPNAGYAKNGYGADLGYSFRFFKGLGLILDLSYSKYSIDEKKLADQIKELTIAQTGFNNVYSSAMPAFWETYSIAGGLNCQLWFGSKKKFGVEPIVFFGESYVYTPQTIYNVRIDDLTFETRNMRKGEWAFMHKEGLNINYLIKNRTILHLNARNSSVSGSGKNMEHIVVGNKTYTRTLHNYNININSLYFGIGVTTRF
jgi:hypothetical protein